MRRLSLNFMPFLALIAMSFTLVSISWGAKRKFTNYTPSATCYRTINFTTVQGINSVTIPVLGQGPVSFTTAPSTFGCSKSCNTVQLNGTSPVVISCNLTNVVGTNSTTSCNETINAICCFHVSASSKAVTDVCTGIPQN